MNQGPFDHDNNQFVVSYELLQLFSWLLEHEQESMRKLINKALKQGLQERMHSADRHEPQISEHLQQSILDFFAILDGMLYEGIDDQEFTRLMQRDLLPAIDHLDAKVYGTNNVAVSIAKATSALETHPERDAKAILCKELLKNWKPAKKAIPN